MKYLYIVDHFVPFPQSEYGGLWVVRASDDEDCFDLISSEDGDLYPEFYSKLRENIEKATKYGLTDDEPSEVLESFLT